MLVNYTVVTLSVMLQHGPSGRSCAHCALSLGFLLPLLHSCSQSTASASQKFSVIDLQASEDSFAQPEVSNPLANLGLWQKTRRALILVRSSSFLCSGATGPHGRGCRRGASCLFCLAAARSGAHVGASKLSLGKRAGIRCAVWLAPVPFGMMKSSSKCMYTNREPMLTALQEVEWWAKHTLTVLQQS